MSPDDATGAEPIFDPASATTKAARTEHMTRLHAALEATRRSAAEGRLQPNPGPVEFTTEVTVGSAPANPAFRVDPAEALQFLREAEREAQVPDATLEDAVNVIRGVLEHHGVRNTSIVVRGTLAGHFFSISVE